MPATGRKSSLQTTTVRLPRQLYEQARDVLGTGTTEATSLNELLVEALRQKLRELRRAQIDAGFAEMKNDAQYRRESDILEDEFATNDRETLRLPEKVD